MPICEIARSEWSKFLASFTRRHDKWLAYLEVIEPSTGQRLSSQFIRLHSISAEAQKEPGFVLIVGEAEKTEVSQIVRAPQRIVVTKNDAGAEEGLEIESPAGTAVVRFRSAVLPELVDGVA